LEGNTIEGLIVFKLPEHFRRLLQTSNMCEGINREIKRRTRVADLFPNESSVLRLLTAILMETSDEWETGRAYFSDHPQP
jgi:transposase-like protein